MELKLKNTASPALGLAVLIVPLWNWNYNAGADIAQGINSFNRTFMELK